MSSKRILCSVLCAGLLAGVASSQSSITTTFASNNGGGNGWGNLFDLTVTGPRSIVVKSIDVNARGTLNTKFTIDVYITSKTYVGKDTKAASWTKVSSGSGVSKPRNTPTPIDVTDFVLGKGAYGIAIFYNNMGMWYTNGNGSNQTVKNADVTLQLGISKSALFGGSTFNPRVWNGTIHYSKLTTAFYGTFGAGCKGSNGVPTLTPATGSVPKLGSILRLNLAGMPTAGGAAFMLTGFSNNSFAGLPVLPASLATQGAPGCFLLTDLSFFIPVGNAAGKGIFVLPVPNLSVLAGTPMFQQALIVDRAANTGGFTMTNAGGGRIGT